MKIGFLDIHMGARDRPGTSGVSDMVWDLARGLVDLGDQVHIVGPYRTDQFPLPDVCVHSYEAPDYLYRNVLTQFRLIQLGAAKLRHIPGLQIVHVTEYVSAALLASWLPDIPVVLTTPGNIFERQARYNPYDPLTSIVYRWAARRSARGCARIIATSHDMAYWWQHSGARPENITVIPLAINLQTFYPHADARLQFGWSPEQKHLLFVGRLAKENCVDYLLDIMALLARKIQYPHLHIVGDGPLYEQHRRRANSLGLEEHVTWHGAVPFEQLPLYYSAADLFIFTRPTGAPPRVIPQAMACGLPVLCVENAGVRDYFVDGIQGRFIDPLNPDVAAETLANIFQPWFVRGNILAQEWGTAALEYARSHFSIPIIASRTRSEVYHSLFPGEHFSDEALPANRFSEAPDSWQSDS